MKAVTGQEILKLAKRIVELCETGEPNESAPPAERKVAGGGASSEPRVGKPSLKVII
jgi:hypothetical protein